MPDQVTAKAFSFYYVLTSAYITAQINLRGGVWNKTAFLTESLQHHKFW